MKELTLEKLFPYAEKSFKEDLISFSQPVSLKKGTMVGYPGAVCEFVPIVLEGSVKVYFTAENGREIFLYRIGRGETCILTNHEEIARDIGTAREVVSRLLKKWTKVKVLMPDYQKHHQWLKENGHLLRVI